MSNFVNNIINAFDNKPNLSGKRIGLFFGSFNPIHVGHLILANYMINATDLNEVWFIVSPQNPHKKKESLLAEHHRLAIVKEAIEDNPMFQVSDIEFKMSKPSYTVDTLAYLEEKYPDNNFAILMGEDNLRSFHKWKNYEVILKKYPIFVYPRIGTTQESEASKPIIKNNLIEHKNIHLVDAPITKISSSLIRKNISSGYSVQYLLTDPVKNYIDEMNFYK